MDDDQLRKILAAQRNKMKTKSSKPQASTSNNPVHQVKPSSKPIKRRRTHPIKSVRSSRHAPKHRISPRSYSINKGVIARYVRRMRMRYCYLKQYPNNEVSTTPLRDVFTYHDVKSDIGDLFEYTTLKKYHQRQHGSAKITTRHNFHTTNPRLSTGFIEYFRQLIIRKYGLNHHDASKLNTARVIYICMSLEADSDIQNIIADGFSVDGNQVMQKIQKERNNDAHSHTVRQSLISLDHKADSILESQTHMYELEGHRFTRIRQMLYALGMFVVDIFSTMCASGAKHFGLMNGSESIIGRMEGNKHRSFFKSGLIAAQHNLHSNSEVTTRRHHER